jgi:hypothetical protein
MPFWPIAKFTTPFWYHFKHYLALLLPFLTTFLFFACFRPFQNYPLSHFYPIFLIFVIFDPLFYALSCLFYLFITHVSAHFKYRHFHALFFAFWPSIICPFSPNHLYFTLTLEKNIFLKTQLHFFICIFTHFWPLLFYRTLTVFIIFSRPFKMALF